MSDQQTVLTDSQLKAIVDAVTASTIASIQGQVQQPQSVAAPAAMPVNQYPYPVITVPQAPANDLLAALDKLTSPTQWPTWAKWAGGIAAGAALLGGGIFIGKRFFSGD